MLYCLYVSMAEWRRMGLSVCSQMAVLFNCGIKITWDLRQKHTK